jgi:hypothetical protein
MGMWQVVAPLIEFETNIEATLIAMHSILVSSA